MQELSRCFARFTPVQPGGKTPGNQEGHQKAERKNYDYISAESQVTGRRFVGGVGVHALTSLTVWHTIFLFWPGGENPLSRLRSGVSRGKREGLLKNGKQGIIMPAFSLVIFFAGR
jgi:hypothetical protein